MGSFAGHSWLTFAKDGGATQSYGTWYEKSSPGIEKTGLARGEELRTKLEADASRARWIDDEAEARLNGVIKKYDQAGELGWTPTRNCSSFSTEGFKAATGEDLNPRNGNPFMDSPEGVRRAIVQANGGEAFVLPPGVAMPKQPTDLTNYRMIYRH